MIDQKGLVDFKEHMMEVSNSGRINNGLSPIFSRKRFTELEDQFDAFIANKTDYRELENFMELFDEDFDEIFGDKREEFVVYKYEHDYKNEKDFLYIETPDLYYKEVGKLSPDKSLPFLLIYKKLIINLAMSHEGLIYDNSRELVRDPQINADNSLEYFVDYFKYVSLRGVTARFFQRIEKNMRKFHKIFRFYLSEKLVRDIIEKQNHDINWGHGLILSAPIDYEYKDGQKESLMRLEDLYLPLIP